MIDKVDLSLLPGRTGEVESLAAKQNPYGWSLARATEFGGVCKTTVQGVDAVLLTGEAGIRAFYDPRHVARRGSKSPADLAFLSDGITPTVPSLDGEAHAARKGALLETMSPSALDGYLPIVHSTISRHLRRWEDVQELELKTELQRLAFEVAAEVFTGLEPEEAMLENFALISLGLVGIGVEDGLKGRDKMLDWYRSAVAASRKRGVVDAPSSALDILVKVGELTDEQIVSETQHLFAGATALPVLACNLLYFLAMQPAAQDQVRAEARKFRNPPTRAELDESTSLQNIVEETARWSPIIDVQTGLVVEPFELGGYRIPKGALLLAGCYATNHDAHLYPAPHTLDPERAQKQSDGCPFSKSSQFTYVPFGGGDLRTGHRCLAESFVYMTEKLLLTGLAANHSWHALNSEEVERALSPQHANQVKVRLQRLRLALAAPTSDIPIEQRRNDG